jgi:hypothetical protein
MTARIATKKCRADAAFMLSLISALTSLAIGAAPVSSAEPNSAGWDNDGFNTCKANIPKGISADEYKYQFFLCCQQNGGTPTDRPDLKGCAQPVPTDASSTQQGQGKTPPPRIAILPPGATNRNYN